MLSNEAGKELRVTDVHSTIVLEALCFVSLTRWTAPSNVLYRKQRHLDFSSHSSSYFTIKPCEQFVDFPLHSGSRMRDKINGRESLQKVLLEACQESDGGQHFWPCHDYNHDHNRLRDVLMTPSFRIRIKHQNQHSCSLPQYTIGSLGHSLRDVSLYLNNCSNTAEALRHFRDARTVIRDRFQRQTLCLPAVSTERLYTLGDALHQPCSVIGQMERKVVARANVDANNLS